MTRLIEDSWILSLLLAFSLSQQVVWFPQISNRKRAFLDNCGQSSPTPRHHLTGSSFLKVRCGMWARAVHNTPFVQRPRGCHTIYRSFGKYGFAALNRPFRRWHVSQQRMRGRLLMSTPFSLGKSWSWGAQAMVVARFPEF